MPTTTVRTLGLTNNASQLIAYSLHSFVLPAFGNGNADVERNVGFPGAPVTARGRLKTVAGGSAKLTSEFESEGHGPAKSSPSLLHLIRST